MIIQFARNTLTISAYWCDKVSTVGLLYIRRGHYIAKELKQHQFALCKAIYHSKTEFDILNKVIL